MEIMWKILFLCGFFIYSYSLPINLLYEHSSAFQLPKDDDVSEKVILTVPIAFYGERYKTIFVNSNGLLSFQTDIPKFFNMEFPLDYAIIAPFYSNVDISQVGSISYYETDDVTLLKRVSTTIHTSFSDSEEFMPLSLFIVTWKDVGYYKNGTKKVNTFQVAISTDGDESYVEFLYPENGIQWIQGTGDPSGLPDARAQVGFVSADDKYFTLPGSGTPLVHNLERLSNMDVPGQWIYKVGPLDDHENVQPPDINNRGVKYFLAPKTCEKGYMQCHMNAKCNDNAEGFCCQCKNHYYGNGKYCIKRDVPLRVNGKIYGKINKEPIEGLDLQSYIVMVDAKAYTGISRIPESIGFDIQALQILGGVIGWLFAKPTRNALNGYQLTGGHFNHTATITFLNSSKQIIIKQKYLGLDVYDQLRLETDVNGELPHIPANAHVEINEYTEDYTMSSPGVLLSTSTHHLSYFNEENEEERLHYTVDQSFLFDYCKYEPQPTGTTWKLKVGRNYIKYEGKDQIVRFGISNKIVPIGEYDPCDEGRTKCEENSACVVEGDNYRCICNPGFQYAYHQDRQICIDVNECELEIDDCDLNAMCVNENGGFSCVCHMGLVGDGHVCEEASSCDQIQCPENSECIADGNISKCKCYAGFQGNGTSCNAIQSLSCNAANNCSPYGYCSINPHTNVYSCNCLLDYEGDGYICTPKMTTTTTTTTTTEEPTTTIHIPEDHQIARCVLLACWCPSGYKMLEGTKYCIPEDEPTTEIVHETPQVVCYNSTLCFCPTGYRLNKDQERSECELAAVSNLETKGFSKNYSCQILNDCHRNAACVPTSISGSFKCTCNPGYEGDGYNCEEVRVSCHQADICDPNAACIFNEYLNKSICVCNPGYHGDGTVCNVTAICTSNSDCGPNEICQYTNSSLNYECVCKTGLERDSQNQCVSFQGNCGGAFCTDNAECAYDNELEVHYCKCISGYDGDGITECKHYVPTCNDLNNCGKHAECLYNSSLDTYACQCNEGFIGDGYYCNKMKDCQVDPAMCHQFATCVADANRKFTCRCLQGYSGNGTLCYRTPKQAGNFLLLNQGMATLKMSYEEKGSKGKLIQMEGTQIAVGLDVDCLGERMYWGDINGKAIRSATYNGTNKTDFITKDIYSPEGISIDWVSRNIYWTDSTKRTIEVANLESNLRKTLFNTGLNNPRGIAVHPMKGKIFWSDWDRKFPRIEWANSDGTQREIFLSSPNVQLPNSLVIDYDTQQLCYSDAGSKTIECVDIDTKVKRTIAQNCTYPFGIAVTDRHVYYSDWITKKVESIDKYSLRRLKPLEVTIVGGSNKLYEIATVQDDCPNLTNVCQYSQCPVDYICLPNGKGSRRCVCGQKIDSPPSASGCNEV